MERLLFVSGRYAQNDANTSVSDFDCIIPFKRVATLEDINELMETLKHGLKAEHVVITNFRRLESPE